MISSKSQPRGQRAAVRRVLGAGLLVVAASFGGALVACDGEAEALGALETTEQVLSSNGQWLYALDVDQSRLAVVNRRRSRVVAEVPVGKAPARLAVAPDGKRIYVSNRGDRSVSVIEHGTWREVARVSVGVEPVGLAVSADSKTLFVVNGSSLESAQRGSLVSVDAGSLERLGELPLGEAPRDITLSPDGKQATVTFRGKSEGQLVDLTQLRQQGPRA